MSGRSGILAGPVLPAILCLALGAALFQEFNRPPEVGAGSGAAISRGGDLPGGRAADPFVLPPVAAFAEIAARPVFSPTRRMPDDYDPEPNIADLAPARREELDVVVVGIVTGPRELALLRSDSGDRLLPMGEGDQLSGWTLVAIEPFRLVFKRDDDEQMVEIEYRGD